MRLTLVTLPVVLLAAACTDTATVGDTKAPKGEDTAADTGDAGSPFSGSWSGTVDGFAEFNTDWETAPYCEGAVTATVEATGNITGSGECIILFGPYLDLVFTTTFAGTVTGEGAAGLDTVIEEETFTHVWDDCTMTGSGDAAAGTLSLEGDSAYYPSGMDSIAGFQQIVLTKD